MKRSDHETKRKGTMVRRCLAMMIAITSFVSLAFPNHGILPRAGAADEETLLALAATEDNTGLIAKFDFTGNTLNDISGNNVQADIEGLDNDGTADISDLFKTEGGNTYLDLSGRKPYLSLKKADGSGVLQGLTEMTVEMRVRTNDNGTNWAFFAAKDETPPKREQGNVNEHYLGILLNNSVTVERFANNDGRPVDPVIGGWTANEWHTVRVVFKTKSTYLCIDDETAAEIGTVYSLEDCIGENGVLWFGHASWSNGEGFNGCIDDIRIWDRAVFDPVKNEEKYIVTDRVIDPKYTTVNMFDYWITAQGDNDYATLDGTDHDTLLKGINEDHLFLFAGETAFSGGPDLQATAAEIGIWNRSTGLDRDDEKNGIAKNTITQGIVRNTLDADGYPVLALDKFDVPDNVTLSGLWATKKNESLAYLFNTVNDPTCKVSYPDVTGLFRINNDGYYEFRSWNTFAELNIDDDNFPKTQTNNNHITLYDKIWGWGLPDEHDGQFFPFNDWSDMFYADPLTGEPVQAYKNDTVNYLDGGSGQTATDEPLNHYFGMTVETEFRQPTDGTIDRGSNKEPMTFEFSGDDDIWIFIDGVLVGDLGGIHGWKNISIDFSIGEIKISDDRARVNVIQTRNLYDMFAAAQKVQSVGWKTITDNDNNTHTIFSDNSIHTLKFFYLERGNQYSNCNITFNLQEPINDHIRKVDENGDPLAGAEFKLYEAAPNGKFVSSKEWHTADEFNKTGDPMTVTISNGSGYASLIKANGDPLSYLKEYYILEETGTPAGYRKNPPIVLKYHSDTRTLKVENKYETGAYASFLTDWNGITSNFADFDTDDGTFNSNSRTVDNDTLKDGLAIIVPIGKIDGQWLPLYGSNTYGWNTVTNGDLVEAIATAAIMQIADPDTQDWYLSWNDSESRLKGHMENLPGDATRYNTTGGDIRLATLFLPSSTLTALGLTVTYTDGDTRYEALKNALKGTTLSTAESIAASLNGIELLYTESFQKENRTVIYVPNEQRELRVRKVNDKDDPIAGAVFALFDDLDNAVNGDITAAVAYGTTGSNGELIFRANALTSSESGYGYAKMDWDSDRTGNPTAVYWLKEIGAPSGYKLNGSIIRVEVGNAGIYANATGFDADGQLIEDEDDGVKVEASLGKLTQTLVKYAEGIVDETLTHITATKQTANSSGGALNINSWRDANGDEAESDELTYQVSGYEPAATFTAEDDYIRVMPRQTAKNGHTAKCDDLSGIDLDGLFSLINTVVVTDKPLSGTGYVPDDPIKPTEPDESSVPDDSSEPNNPSESNDPSEPDRSDDLNASDDNPHTGLDARSIFRVTVLTLSLIAAVYPQRKRDKHRK